MKNLHRSGERGQDALEFALIIPVLFLILMGIFDMGRATFSYSALQNAAREGARFGVIHPTDSAGIEAKVRSMAVGLDPGALTVTTTSPNSNTIQVHLSYVFTIVTPGIQLFFGSSQVTFVGESTMWIEK
jgi:Flp pilus assembly protein TadG